ncbi:MAG: hypothetical protein ACJ735_04240 [Actinomycetes bacterium]
MTDPDVPISAYAGYVRRHAPTLAACMAVGLVVGVAAGHVARTYVGTAAVLAPPLDLSAHGVPNVAVVPLREKDAVTPDTEAQIATSTPVLTAVQNATGLRYGFADLARRVTIDAPTNTQVLTISFEARHARAAVIGAQAAAEGFIAARARLISGRQAADAAALDAQISALRNDLAAASTRIVSTGPSGGTAAQLDQSAILDKIRSLQRTKTRLATAATSAGTLLRPATESGVRARLGRQVPITSGLLLGLLAGLGVGRLRRRQYITAWDLHQAVGKDDDVDVFTLGPVVLPRRHRLDPRRTGVDAGLKRLRNMTVASGGGLTVFTGPARRGVTAALAAGLARSLAQLGEGVAVLVPAGDLALRSALGLSSVALRDVNDDPVATGLRRAQPGDVVVYRLATRTEAAGVAATLRRAYPHVVVVLPGPPDAVVCAIARIADRVLVTAERRRTLVRDVVSAIRRLRLVGAPVTASLLVRAAR